MAYSAGYQISETRPCSHWQTPEYNALQWTPQLTENAKLHHDYPMPLVQGAKCFRSSVHQHSYWQVTMRATRRLLWSRSLPVQGNTHHIYPKLVSPLKDWWGVSWEIWKETAGTPGFRNMLQYFKRLLNHHHPFFQQTYTGSWIWPKRIGFDLLNYFFNCTITFWFKSWCLTLNPTDVLCLAGVASDQVN